MIKCRRMTDLRNVKRIKNNSIRKIEEDRLLRKWHWENGKLDTQRAKEDVIGCVKKHLSKQSVKRKLEEERNLRKLLRSKYLSKKAQAINNTNIT